MPWPDPVTLAGAHARLEPLSPAHEAGLADAARDGELWKLWYTAVPSPQGMAAEIRRRLDLRSLGSMLPFTVFDAGGRIAGMTTYMNIDAANRRVEIGSTWTARSSFRAEHRMQAVAAHHVDTPACIAVEFRTIG
jgi:RimJ/RimL family protein N-acetyltransferase